MNSNKPECYEDYLTMVRSQGALEQGSLSDDDLESGSVEVEDLDWAGQLEGADGLGSLDELEGSFDEDDDDDDDYEDGDLEELVDGLDDGDEEGEFEEDDDDDETGRPRRRRRRKRRKKRGRKSKKRRALAKVVKKPSSTVRTIAKANAGQGAAIRDGMPFVVPINCQIQSAPYSVKATMPHGMMQSLMNNAMCEYPHAPVVNTASESSGSATCTVKPATTDHLVGFPFFQVILGAPSLNDVPGSLISLDIDGCHRFGQAQDLGIWQISPIETGKQVSLIIVPAALVSGSPVPMLSFIAEDFKHDPDEATVKDQALVVAATGLSTGAKVTTIVPTPAHKLWLEMYNILTAAAK